jgi:chemotaxis family two-component system sensor kinase Cph1
MNDLSEFFQNLFRPDSWPARWNCGHWTGFHGWLYILSSLAIAAAYFSIPVILYIVIRRSANKLPFQKVFWLFILFILACGFTHVFDALMFWFPVYRVSAVVLFLTAVVSWAALLGLFKVMPAALTLKSPLTLERIIFERTEELGRSNEYLKKINTQLERSKNESQLVIRQKDEFLSIASHELKTPVTSLKAITQILHAESVKRENDNETMMLSKMDAQINKLTALINDLLNTSNLQGSRVAYKKQHFNLRDLIIEVSDDIQKTTADHKIIVEKNEPVIVYADKERITQVLNNFLTNAIKYSPNTKEIIIGTKQDDNYITCVVRDFGIGIPEEQIPKIFDRFYRVSGENMHTYPGMGLGLYIAKDIIEKHNGKIWAVSSKGKGSAFYFGLPIGNN